MRYFYREVSLGKYEERKLSNAKRLARTGDTIILIPYSLGRSMNDVLEEF